MMIMMIMKEDDQSMIMMKIKSQLRGGFEQGNKGEDWFRALVFINI